MARGRMVSTSISTDRHVNMLSDAAALAFTWTIPHLDREGAITGEPGLLWALVAPLRPHMRDAFGGFIEQWVELGMVQRFDHERYGVVLFFPNFAKHQQGLRYDREPESVFGRLPADFRQTSGKLPADFRQTSGRVPAEDQDQTEVKEQQKVNTHSVCVAFDEFGIWEPARSRIVAAWPGLTALDVRAWQASIEEHNRRNKSHPLGVAVAIKAMLSRQRASDRFYEEVEIQEDRALNFIR